jgi:hypothetical protein
MSFELDPDMFDIGGLIPLTAWHMSVQEPHAMGDYNDANHQLRINREGNR